MKELGERIVRRALWRAGFVVSPRWLETHLSLGGTVRMSVRNPGRTRNCAGIEHIPLRWSAEILRAVRQNTGGFVWKIRMMWRIFSED